MELTANEPVFSSSLLLVAGVSVPQVRLQLTRWVKAGRLLQLRRGVYSLASTFRKVEPHPFLVANALHRGSYVSLQSALAFHGVIPEHVPVVTSVGGGRPATVRNPLGSFQLNHIATGLLYGFSQLEVARGQQALVATPEKALLDLVYLTPRADSPVYLQELRLQNAGAFDVPRLAELARRSGKPKLIRAAGRVARQLAEEEGSLP